ncbi:MAG: T9SS type A sorting domain-containing protein [Bacteroidota bacterium]
MKKFNLFYQAINVFALLFLLNSAFGQVFETTIGDLADVETTFDGKVLPNGNYIMLSNTLSFGPDWQIMLTELDPGGVPVNVVSLTDSNAAGTSYFGTAFELDIDSAGNHIGYFITGHRFSGNTEEMIVVRTDLGGSMTWASNLDVVANGTVYKESGVSIERQSNGDIVVIGRSKDLNSGLKQIIGTRLTAGGTVVWARRYGSSPGANFMPNESCNGLRNTMFGQVQVVAITGKYEETGNANTFVSLVNAATGFEIMKKVYLSNGVSDQGRAIVQHPNNLRYMVVGESLDGMGNSDLWVANIRNNNLNLLFSNIYDLGINYAEFVGRDVCLSLGGNTAVIAGMLRENTAAGLGIARTFALELPFSSTAVPAWFYSYTYSDPNVMATESINQAPGVAGSASGYFITTEAFLSTAFATDQHAIRVDGGGLHGLVNCPEINENPIRNAGGQFFAKTRNFTPAQWHSFDLATKARDLIDEPCPPPLTGGPGNNLIINENSGHILTGQPVLFPNPVQTGEKATLTVELENESEVSVTVFDTTGRLVYTTTEYLAKGQQQIAILTNNLIPGTYFVQTTTEQGRKSLKLNVQ